MKSAWADGSNAAVQVAQCVIIVSLKSQKEIQRAAQLLYEAFSGSDNASPRAAQDGPARYGYLSQPDVTQCLLKAIHSGRAQFHEYIFGLIYIQRHEGAAKACFLNLSSLSSLCNNSQRLIRAKISLVSYFERNFLVFEILSHNW